MNIKKIVYVAEILIEVAKVLLPFVKARQITIHAADDSQDGNQPDAE